MYMKPMLLTNLVFPDVVESNDERDFDKTYEKVVDYGKAGGNELEIGYYDVELTRMVLVMMNEGWISRVGLHGLIKLGASELEVIKSGVMQCHLPN